MLQASLLSGRRAASPDALPTPAERAGLIALAIVLVAFGCLFELRSALQQMRKGDLDVFLRAAWAVRTGGDIYTATDDNDHHYHYPPFLAVMLVPLADPPAGQAPLPGTIPFTVSVATWYVLSLLLLALALEMLATALEEKLYPPDGRPRLGSRRWWALRLYPFLACLPAVGGALMRGQVDMILVALFAGMIACALRGKRARAGLFLAVAISIKVIPAFLLIYPLWKRDTRWLAGCGVGLVLCLGVVPVLAFGPRQTVNYYREWDEVVLRPGLTEKGDQTRAEELTQVTATDSQSFLAVTHNLRYPTQPRPVHATAGERQLHWGLSGLFTLMTLAVAVRVRRRGAEGPVTVAVLLGNLILLMILSSPVCHLHYFSLSVFITMGMLAAAWQTRGHERLLAPGLCVVFTYNIVANALPRIPGLQVLRDGGLATSAALVLWACGFVILWKSVPQPALATSREHPAHPNLAA